MYKPETLWCCVGTGFKRGHYYSWQTLACTRRESIAKMLQGVHEGAPASKWDFWKSRGWVCIRVKVSINAIKPLK